MTGARVLKLGGSLLTVADWPERLRAWLVSHPAPMNFLLVGGGEIVEAVRELDAVHHFPASFSHWLCIDLLSATTRIAGQLLPEFPCIRTSAELQKIIGDRGIAEFQGQNLERTVKSCISPGNMHYLVDVHCFYRSHLSSDNRPIDDEPGKVSYSDASHSTESKSAGDPITTSAVAAAWAECPLPEGWQTTSDSLAAWLTRVVGARELVLFKSTSPAPENQTPQAWCEQGIVDEVFAHSLPTGVCVQIVNLISGENGRAK